MDNIRSQDECTDYWNQPFHNNDGSATARSSNQKCNYFYYVWGRKNKKEHKDSFQSKANDGNEISLWPAALP